MIHMNDIELKNLPKFPNITSPQLAKIEKRMGEFYRAKAIIGHSKSQSQYTLLTLTMLDDSPLSRMKQCLSQISRKYGAVKEAYYNIEKKKLEVEELAKNRDELSFVKIKEIKSNIVDTEVAMENSLRQIGMFQDFYDEIRISNKIEENWNEQDYEAQEIQNMVRKSFRLGIQEISTHNSDSKSSVEYWEQLGIHPQVAEIEIRKYLNQINSLITTDKDVTVQLMYNFLDDMANKFKESYKLALKRIGLTDLGSKEFQL